jgi:hypothetical protein
VCASLHTGLRVCAEDPAKGMMAKVFCQYYWTGAERV